MEEEDLCKIMAASYVGEQDLELTDYRKKKALEFQQCYCQLVRAAGKNTKRIIQKVAERAGVINYEFRSTGDGLTLSQSSSKALFFFSLMPN